MTINIPVEPVVLNEEPLEEVEDFTYLGSILSKDNGAGKDIKARLNKGRSAFAQLQPIWKANNYSLRTKLQLYNSNVKSVLLSVWVRMLANNRKQYEKSSGLPQLLPEKNK